MKMFSIDDIVWAKSSLVREIFWPAKVIETDSDLANERSKKPVVACVNFLAEDTFEAITNASNVQPFNCTRKEIFLKKGRSLKKQEKRLKFERAVKEAEKCIELYGKRAKNARTKTSSNIKSECDERENKTDYTSICLANSVDGMARRTRSNRLIESATTKASSTKANKELKNVKNSIDDVGKKKENIVKNSTKESLKEAVKRTPSKINENTRRRKSNTSPRKTISSQTLAKSFIQETSVLLKARKSNKDTNLETIPEENELEMEEAKRTPRQCRLEKRSRREIEKDKLVEKEAEFSDFGRENKRLRREEGSQDTDGHKSEVKERLLNGSGCETQDNALPMDVDENLSNKNSDKTDTVHSSKTIDQPLKAMDSCLVGSLNAVSCSNTSDEHNSGNLESEGLQASDNCGSSGLASEAKEGRLEDHGNENNVENLAVIQEDIENEDETEDNAKDDGSSDEDSLPEAFSPSSEPKKHFVPGDVVWAKHRKFPFWPAQIRRTCGKGSHYYYLEFLPKSKSRGMKIRRKNIISFATDYATCEHYKNQEINNSDPKDFEEAVKQAEDILMRRAGLQKDDSVLDEIEDRASSELGGNDEPSSPGNVEQDKPVSEEDKPVVEQLEGQEDGESGFNSSDMDNENRELEENSQDEKQRQQVSRYGNILNELQLCKQRLLDIYRGKAVSSRHKEFHGSVSQRNHLARTCSFGPIYDDETRNKIIWLLKSWYDAETKTDSLTLDYIYGVWLPEALIYYIQVKDNLSAEDAEKSYLDFGTHVDKKDVEEATAWLNKQKIDKTTREETVERARQKLLFSGISS